MTKQSTPQNAILKPGDFAPDFCLPTNAGDKVKLSDLRGNFIVLYFYPKDMTPGCTTEAIAFSELNKDFASYGAKIIGVSRDSIARHEKFISKYDLSISLASDENGKVCESYGVWILKKLYGREYMGIQRATFLIDKDGKIIHIWPKVRVKGHAEEVLETLKSYA